MSPRVPWVVKRGFQALFTFFAVVNISFFLTKFMPGGPEDFIRARLLQQMDNPDPERVNELVQIYVNVNPEEPILVQYWDYMSSVATGNLGQSIFYDEPVGSILIEALPWTMLVMSIAIVLMFVIGVSLGTVMAFVERTNWDYGLTFVSLVLNSVPFYVVAILSLYWFAGLNEWFPEGGRYAIDSVSVGFNLPFLQSALYHAALPVFSLVITGFGGYALSMRANSISVIGEDYLRVAQLRGLPSKRIMNRYVGRNAILPLYTGVVIQIGFLFGGAVILEQIFQYLGVGYYLFRGINARDYPLMMGGFILISVGVVFAIMIADMTYGYLDPRLRQSNEEDADGVDIGRVARRARGVFTRSESQAATVGTSGTLAEIESNAAATTESPSLAERIRATGEWAKVRAIILWEDVRTRIGLGILLFFIGMGTIAPSLLTRPQPYESPTLARPFENTAYILGTDALGRGLFKQVVFATPPMLKMIVAGAVFTVILATIIATVAGYLGGTVDRVLMTVSDIAMTIPGLPLIIIVAVALEPKNPFLIGILLTINAWAGMARTLRSEVLSIREESYVEASTIMGLPTRQTIIDDILPNIMPLILINFANTGRNVIFSSVGLYFLGILPFSTANWGVMMNRAYQTGGSLYTTRTAHWFIVPMAAVTLLSLGLTLFAQGADRLFNPRIRARHSSDEEEQRRQAKTAEPAD